jgi:hypothetical protein
MLRKISNKIIGIKAEFICCGRKNQASKTNELQIEDIKKYFFAHCFLV